MKCIGSWKIDACRPVEIARYRKEIVETAFTAKTPAFESNSLDVYSLLRAACKFIGPALPAEQLHPGFGYNSERPRVFGEPACHLGSLCICPSDNPANDRPIISDNPQTRKRCIACPPHQNTTAALCTPTFFALIPCYWH
jgi:hypothetical protein